jgi:hypothetical protein
MRKTTLASAIIVALILLASALTQPVNADIVDNNGTRIASGPYIICPVNTTYNSRFIMLDISFSAQLFSKVRFTVTYSLDGTPNVIVRIVSSPSLIWSKNHVIGSVRLPELSDGSHRLSVIVKADAETGDSYWDREIVYFTVETTPPKIRILSPLAEIYTKTSVSVSFAAGKPKNWMGYSLDAEENITVAGNFTLTDLSNGLHNLTVYANDTYGNMGASETVTFTVSVPEPFPTTPVAAASIASVALAAVGILVYFRKRRRQALAAS